MNVGLSLQEAPVLRVACSNAVVGQAEVGIVLDGINGNAQLRASAFQAERPFEMRVEDVVQLVLIPPEMARMIVFVVEDVAVLVEDGVGCQLDGVAEKPEVEVGIGIQAKLSGVVSRHAQIARNVIVERLALRLAQLSSDVERLFVERFVSVVHVGQGIVAYVIGSKSLQACFCPFVETFEQGHG